MNVLVRSQELPLFARLGPHPRAAPRCPRRRRAVRVLGPHGGDRAEHPAPTVPLADGVRSPVGRREEVRAATPGLPRRGPRPHPRGRADHRGRPPAAHRSEGLVVELGRRQAGPRVPVPPRAPGGDPGGAATSPASTTCPSACCRPPPWRLRRRRAEARKELLALAARSLGVATLEDLTDYHRQGTAACRPLVAELVEEGVLQAARVEGWRKPAYVHRDATIARSEGAGPAQPVRLTGLEARPHRASLRLLLPHRDLHPRRSGSTATTCCRSCSTGASSGGSTSRPIARRRAARPGRLWRAGYR